MRNLEWMFVGKDRSAVGVQPGDSVLHLTGHLEGDETMLPVGCQRDIDLMIGHLHKHLMLPPTKIHHVKMKESLMIMMEDPPVGEAIPCLQKDRRIGPYTNHQPLSHLFLGSDKFRIPISKLIVDQSIDIRIEDRDTKINKMLENT